MLSLILHSLHTHTRTHTRVHTQPHEISVGWLAEKQVMLLTADRYCKWRCQAVNTELSPARV